MVVAESEALKVRPRGKYGIYTTDSYTKYHQGRTLEQDGLVAGPVKLKSGMIIHGVKVWEGCEDWAVECSQCPAQYQLPNGSVMLCLHVSDM